MRLTLKAQMKITDLVYLWKKAVWGNMIDLMQRDKCRSKKRDSSIFLVHAAVFARKANPGTLKIDFIANNIEKPFA